MIKEERKNLDLIDKKILAILQKDASLTVKEIAEQVGLSTTPCWKRVQRLELIGVIKSKVAILDPLMVGGKNIVFIKVKAPDHGEKWAQEFSQISSQIEEILEINRVSGDIDFLLKAVVTDMAGYDALLRKIVSKIKVQDISSMFSIEQVKYSTAIPLND